MNNSTISRKKVSSNVRVLEDKFYSARKSIPCSRKISRNLSSSIFKDISYTDVRNRNEEVQVFYFAGHGSSSGSVSLTFEKTTDIYCDLFEVIASLSASTSRKLIVDACQSHQATTNSNIREYFSLKPSTRAQKRKEYVQYVESTEDVFDILKLGNTKSIVDAYDGAVDLLAESDRNLLIHSVEQAREKYISDNNVELAQSWEKNWEILIKALSCALNLKPHKKMSLLLSLCDPRYKLSRLIKLTLIDAIVDLDLDSELIMVMLQIFISERESDNFVRNYAKEQAGECL